MKVEIETRDLEKIAEMVAERNKKCLINKGNNQLLMRHRNNLHVIAGFLGEKRVL